MLNGVSAAMLGVLALLAGLAWAWTDHSAQQCGSAIVSALAQDQCTTVTFWHDVAGIAALVLAALFVAAVWPRRRQS